MACNLPQESLMRILVTGGTGVIGVATIDVLLRQGHTVRLLSRNADTDASRWSGVEPFAGDITDLESVAAAADGFDAILHIVGIVEENRPNVTFEGINVGGTRNAVDAATEAGARRFVFVSSLGADRGKSDYHASKRAGEELVRSSGLSWTIVRPGNVYGPGDDEISLILRMVRSLPAVPVIDGGDQPFQPIWHEDVAKALAAVIEREDLAGQTLEIAGAEQTSVNNLLDRFGEITGRKPRRVSVPSRLASIASYLASAVGMTVPLGGNKLTMLKEKNVIENPEANALTGVLGITPTSLDQGLRALVDSLPEQSPADGVGNMHHKRYLADIVGGRYDAPALIDLIREQATTLMPVEFGAEPETPQGLDVGATLTAALPLRGNIQVRIEAIERTRLVMATVAGHPLAGLVQFSAEDLDSGVRFAVDTYTRAASLVDRVGMSTIGGPMQDSNWRALVGRVVEASEGTAPGDVQTSSTSLSDEEAELIEDEFRTLVQHRQRTDQRESARPRGA